MTLNKLKDYLCINAKNLMLNIYLNVTITFVKDWPYGTKIYIPNTIQIWRADIIYVARWRFMHICMLNILRTKLRKIW